MYYHYKHVLLKEGEISRQNHQVLSSTTIPLTLSRGCWELTIHAVDLEASEVLGSAGLGGGEQGRVMDREVTVVVLQDGQSCSLYAGVEKRRVKDGCSSHGIYFSYNLIGVGEVETREIPAVIPKPFFLNTDVQ